MCEVVDVMMEVVMVVVTRETSLRKADMGEQCKGVVQIVEEGAVCGMAGMTGVFHAFRESLDFGKIAFCVLTESN